MPRQSMTQLGTRLLMMAALAAGCGDDGDPGLAPDAGISADAAVNLDAGIAIDAGSMADATPMIDAAPLDPPEPPPAVRLVFPPRDALSRQDTVHVRGVAPDDGSITQVTVNGAPVTTDDGYATWSQTVSLTAGANPITIVATTTDGSTIESSNQTIVYSPESLDTPRHFTAIGDAGYALEANEPLVVAIDLTVGSHVVASGPGVGTGPSWQDASRIEAGASTLYVLADKTETGQPALFSIDPQTGDRAIVADALVGAGPMVTAPRDLVIDDASNRAFITDFDQPGVLAIDLVVGTRSWLSTTGVGTGPALAAPDAIALDSSNGRLLVEGDGRLLAVDLATGDRAQLLSDFYAREIALDVLANSILSVQANELRRTDLGTGETIQLSTGALDIDRSIADGPEFGSVAGLIVDADRHRALVVDPGWRLPLAADLRTGNRITPWGYYPLGPVVAAVDESAMYVSDDEYNSVWRLDLHRGNRVLVTGFGRGDGVELRRATSLSLDPAGEQLVYTDYLGYDVYAHRSIVGIVDIQTGDRTNLSASNLAPDSGSGTRFHAIKGMAVDYDGHRALVGTVRDLGSSSAEPCARNALVSTDLSTGARVVHSGQEFSENPDDVCAPDVGSGPLPGFLGVASVPGAPYVLASGWSSLFRIDLVTGDRTVVSDETTGQGPEPDSLYGSLSFHPAENRALVVGWPTPAVFSIDVVTGDRELLLDLSDVQPTSNPGTRFAVMDDAGATVFVSHLGDRGLTAGLWMIDRLTGQRLLMW